ncbi:tubulin binding cofactor C-domain-containing protein [Lipomyces oligophaga]|uniref:tubulin binding cofactor C-domain-containing protein n=1 Tax=Lipomyces oligophaga TaxID=45792 RepID=UPI0034CDD0F8
MSKLHPTQQSFYVHFGSSKAKIEALLTPSVPTPTSEQDSISASSSLSSSTFGLSQERLVAAETALGQLQRDVQQAIIYLPPYDQNLYSTQLDQLEKAVSALRQSLHPQGRFAFSTRTRPSISESLQSPPITPPVSAPLTIALPNQSVRQIQHHKGKFIVVRLSPEISTLLLNNLEDCVVYIPPTTTTISSAQMTACTNSILLLSATVNGPVHISRVVTCVVAIRSCHQFRVHETTDSDIILGRSVRSVVIEKCEDLIFARADYSNTTDSLKSISPFTDVIADFDCPTLVISPHWTTIDENSITKFNEPLYSEIVTLAASYHSFYEPPSSLSEQPVFGSTSDTAEEAILEQTQKIRAKALSRNLDLD